MINVYVIGCGGIGGYLLNLLPYSIASLAIECQRQMNGIEGEREVLSDTYEGILPSPVRELVLVDGDRFDPHNAIRQAAGFGSKLAVQLDKIENHVLGAKYLADVTLKGYDTYVTPRNISDIIPRVPNDTVSSAWRCQEGRMGELTNSLLFSTTLVPVVFLCVDNHKTRYEVARYMETFDSCILINGGNKKTCGNINIYERQSGRELDPRIYELYPEIKDPASKRPDEIPCGEISHEHDQLAIVNSMIAAYMCNMFRQVTRPDSEYGLERKTRRDCKRMNEVIVNIDNNSAFELSHSPVDRCAREALEQAKAEADKEALALDNTLAI